MMVFTVRGQPLLRHDGNVPEVPERVRRRLDEIFGEVLPSVTRDELPEPGAEGPEGSAEEDWLRANRPPHHDRSE